MPARVLAIDGPTAIVDVDGRRRRASLLVEPDVTVGDWVQIGVGTVLRRLEPAEARSLTRTLESAGTAAAAAHSTEGGPT